jgi:uncharacterized protein YjiS (DUF1127 family)
MTAAILNHGALRASCLSTLALRLLRAALRRRNARLAAAQLHAMTDHQLADLGIHRGQIEAVVRGRMVR